VSALKKRSATLNFFQDFTQASKNVQLVKKTLKNRPNPQKTFNPRVPE